MANNMNGDSLKMNGHIMNGNGFLTNGQTHGKHLLPDAPIKCKWSQGIDLKDSPHIHRGPQPRPKLFPDILHAVGHTPLVRLNKIPKSLGVECDVYVKCEYLSAGGSIKDRIALRMILEAEESGILKPGGTIIEATSGNTGLGLAMACAVKGYRCIIVMSEKMSNEKMDTLLALGAEIHRYPAHLTSDDINGPFGISENLRKKIPNSVILNQYENAGNPLAHYDSTAVELLEDCDYEMDMVVMGAGTGGTITGIGRKIKDVCPACIVVGVDPDGSVLAKGSEHDEPKFFEMEGIGYDFIPTSFDGIVVDKWIKTNDKESYIMSRRLIKEEGILCGGSSGATVLGALKAAKAAGLKGGQKCVVVMADGLRNYMTKFLSPIWMEAKGFMEPEERSFPWWSKPIHHFKFSKPEAISPSVSIREAVGILKKQNVGAIPVIDDEGQILGAVTLKNTMKQINLKAATMDDSVNKIVDRTVYKLSPRQHLGLASRILEIEPYVMIIDTCNPLNCDQEKTLPTKPVETYLGLITTIDILELSALNSRC